MMANDEKDSLVEEHDFLRVHAPHGLDVVGSNALEEIHEMRNKLIREQRVTYMYLAHEGDVDSGQMQLGLLKKIFNPKLVQKSHVSPSLSQQINLFLSYLYVNIGTFAQAVTKFRKNEMFSHLVTISIPSLFSNFTSWECVETAYVFYLHVINLTTPETATPIFSPIFNSIICFRYIETIMAKFLPKFVIDKRCLKKLKSNSSATLFYAKTLFSLICNNVRLLPTKILTLLHLMGTTKWPIYDMSKLFLDCFFSIQAEIYIKASPFSIFLPQFKVVMAYIRSDESNMSSLYSIITKYDTTVHIPSLYRPFDQTFITCLVSVYDVNVLWHCIMNLGGELPYSVRELDLKTEKLEQPFFISFFPKTLSSQEEAFTPLIFKKKTSMHPDSPTFEHMYQRICSTNDGTKVDGYEMAKKVSKDPKFVRFALEASVADLRLQANSFEKLMWYRMHCSIIHEWLLIGESRTHMYKNAAISSCPVQTLDAVFPTYTSVFETPVTAQAAYIKTKLPTIIQAMNANKSYFDNINACWVKLLAQKKEMIETSVLALLSPSMQELFWDSVGILMTLDHVPLERRFFVIFKAVSMINIVPMEKKTIDSLVVLAITFAAPESLLCSFLVLSSFLMRDTDFIRTLQEADLLSWTRCESTILKFVVSEDFPQLQITVVGLQGLLISFDPSRK